MYVHFEWDPRKRVANLEKHNTDFEIAIGIFEGPIHIRTDHRRDYGEDRFVATGLLDGREMVVIYTLRGQVCRLISARKAREDERAAYRAAFPAKPP